MQRAVFNAFDLLQMKAAIRLAQSVKGRTGDNPAVGAVIYGKNKVLGQGRTHPPGQDHAEKDAIKDAGSKARGAAMAVTLEPCCHFGRTGPCTRSIIAAGIKRVIIAVKDPNPLVAGKGIRELELAGIRVETGLMEKEATQLNEDFFKFIRTKTPLVTLKAAMTLNGLIAADSGNSRWITSFPARKKVHALRSLNDAVLVGRNTVLIDNPRLDARHVKGRNPVRVILSGNHDISPMSRLAKSAGQIRTILISARRMAKPACKHIEYIHIPAKGKRIPVKAVLRCLALLGIKSVLVEGGSTVFTAFIEQKCVDIFYLFLSPRLLGSGIPFVKGKTTKRIEEALEMRDVRLEKAGNDILVTGRPS